MSLTDILKHSSAIPTKNKDIINLLRVMNLDVSTKEVLNRIDTQRPLALYGAGWNAIRALDFLTEKGFTVHYIFDDSKPSGSTWKGIPVLGFESLTEIDELQVIITCSYSGLLQRLHTAGISNRTVIGLLVSLNLYLEDTVSLFDKNKEKITELYDLLADEESCAVFLSLLRYRLGGDLSHVLSVARPVSEQYFDSSVVSISHHEVFVDGGAYTGDTLQAFTQHTSNNFKEYFAYEPDEQSFSMLLSRTNHDMRIKAYPIGLYHESTILPFDMDGSVGTSISDAGDISIQVTSLDKHLCSSPTFIKMDLEGAEYDALLGAKKTIIDNKPLLAVCVYHKPCDLWELPLLIHSWVPEYKIFLRHYEVTANETVFYAVPSSR